MAKFEILVYPNPVLQQASRKVESFDAALSKLLDSMAETMYQANGVGLAAPQVGVLKRVTVVDVSENKLGLRDFINPEIIWRSGSIASEEGCLSIPDYRDTLKRSEQIVVKAQDRRGAEFELKAEGLLARCLQHEIDHLDGILFVDRLSRIKKEMFRRWFKKKSEGGE